jgi:hypothetical protein
MKTILKKVLIWAVCRHLVSEKLVTWAFERFDLKGL